MQGEGVAVGAQGRPIGGGGAPGPYKEGYEKIMRVAASKVSLSSGMFRYFLEGFGSFSEMLR